MAFGSDAPPALHTAVAPGPLCRFDTGVIVASVRRGLLKDLANTPTQIVCGWRLYGPDLGRLRDLAGDPIAIDLLTGECRAAGSRLDPPLAIADDLVRWLRDRFERDGVPPGVVARATSTLTPRIELRALVIEVETVVETTRGTYDSRDTTRWAPGDVADD